MEFTSETPPQGLGAYFGVEGPYLLAGVLVIRKVMAGSLNPLKARRSVVKYSSKRVPKAATQRALESAIMAPNHFLSEPWRFYTCGPETKAKLCGLNADKRKAAEGVPEWLVVTCASEHKLTEEARPRGPRGVCLRGRISCCVGGEGIAQADDAAPGAPPGRLSASAPGGARSHGRGSGAVIPDGAVRKRDGAAAERGSRGASGVRLVTHCGGAEDGPSTRRPAAVGRRAEERSPSRAARSAELIVKVLRRPYPGAWRRRLPRPSRRANRFGLMFVATARLRGAPPGSRRRPAARSWGLDRERCGPGVRP